MLFPNFRHTFEYRILDAMAYELRQQGHEALISWRPAHSHIVSKLAKAHDVDVVFQVNRPRPNDDIFPKNTRHISWYQDCRKPYLEKAIKQSKDDDIIYYMADLESLTGGKPNFSVYSNMLAPAVDRRLVTKAKFPGPDSYDLSMIGTIMKPFHMDEREETLAYEGQDYAEYFWWYMKKNMLYWKMPKTWIKYFTVRKEWRELYGATVSKTIMETHFSPLDGHSNRAQLDSLMDEVLGECSDSKWNRENDKVIYLRLLNRLTIARYILDISANVKFYGSHWDNHDEFKRYAGGFIHNQGEINRLFNKTKIVVHDNPDGCNLHDRVFYALASGSLLLTGLSDWDNTPGGFRNYFEPSIHYAAYTHDSFHEQARRYLSDEDARKKIGEAANKQVLAEHSYYNRVQQILTDLGVN